MLSSQGQNSLTWLIEFSHDTHMTSKIRKKLLITIKKIHTITLTGKKIHIKKEKPNFNLKENKKKINQENIYIIKKMVKKKNEI